MTRIEKKTYDCYGSKTTERQTINLYTWITENDINYF